jgi:hypothetical protein
MKTLIAIFLLCASVIASGADTQIDYTFYRDPANALIGKATGAQFLYPGDALSASSFRIRADLTNRPVKSALWVIAWNPKTGTSPTVVRLVKADDGPANVTEIARVTGTNYNNPKVEQVDITAQIQDIMAGGIKKHLLQQTAGNGANGPYIYASWVEIIWGDTLP